MTLPVGLPSALVGALGDMSKAVDVKRDANTHARQCWA